MTDHVLDVASYQGALSIDDVLAAGFAGVNLKTSHEIGLKSVHPDVAGWAARAKARRMWISTFHFLTGEASGRAQAEYAYGRLHVLGLVHTTVHQVDCESTATLAILREYLTTMQRLLGRKISVYSGRWWFEPRGWNVTDLTPFLWSSPKAGYVGSYPGDTSAHWAGYGGWPVLSIMQYGVNPLPGGTIDVSKSAVRDPGIWARLSGGGTADMPVPVCDTGDLEQFAGTVVRDPWIEPGRWLPISAPKTQTAPVARALPRAWIVVPSLEALRHELNTVAPGRDTASDGGIGDAAHSASVSDHNPDETGETGSSSDADSIDEVHARDFDKDLNVPGLTMEAVCQYLVSECRAGRITWIKYIIFNRRIWTASGGWVTQAYTGSNPHDQHMHVSSKYDTASENSTREAGLASLIEEGDGMADITQERFSELMTEWVRKADIVPWYREDGTAIPADPADPKRHTVTMLTYFMRTGRLAAQFTPERANQLAALSAQIAAGEAQDVAEAATLAAAVESLREIRTLLDAGGGDPDVAAVLARLDALPGLLGDAGRQAAEDAARTVLDRVAQASRAEAEAYGPTP